MTTAARTGTAAEADEGIGLHRPRTPEAETGNTPHIWVGSLSDYNHGVLHGRWINAACDTGEVEADIHAMLSRSPLAAETGEPAEEWGIFDYNHFGTYRVDEYEAIETVAAIARGIAEYGGAFAAWSDLHLGDADRLAAFADAYIGQYPSAAAYVEQLADDLGYLQLVEEAIPSSLRPYVSFDVEMLARDMQINGDITACDASDGGVWIFHDP